MRTLSKQLLLRSLFHITNDMLDDVQMTVLPSMSSDIDRRAAWFKHPTLDNHDVMILRTYDHNEMTKEISFYIAGSGKDIVWSAHLLSVDTGTSTAQQLYCELVSPTGEKTKWHTSPLKPLLVLFGLLGGTFEPLEQLVIAKPRYHFDLDNGRPIDDKA